MPSFAALIGRFQPFHDGHRFLIESALKQFDEVVIVVGSANRARSTVNPFTYEERVMLMRANFQDEIKRIHFVSVPDVFYDEALWCQLVKDAILALTQKNPVTLLGHSKDQSSYYLAEFPEWSYLELPNYKAISATPMRFEYLLYGIVDDQNFSEVTQNFLQEFKKTDEYAWLHSEAKFIKSYKESWNDAPYPPIFVTTDTVITCRDHILLIERNHFPGKGLYALPGGFVEVGEWIKAALFRELIEETQIDVSIDKLNQSLVTIQVFDYPGRSQIGRVITHAGLINLKNQDLPKVEASDDAGRAFWLALKDFAGYADRLHDDHFQIVQHFMRQGLLK